MTDTCMLNACRLCSTDAQVPHPGAVAAGLCIACLKLLKMV